MSNEFESDLQPCKASAFRVGDVILLEECACKIVQMSISKTGKHGSAKVNVTGVCIFTGKKCKYSCSSTHKLLRVIVKKVKYEVLGINDGILQVVDDIEDNNVDIDLQVLELDMRHNKEKLGILQEKFNKLNDQQELFITVIYALGKSIIQEVHIKDTAMSKKNPGI